MAKNESLEKVYLALQGKLATEEFDTTLDLVEKDPSAWEFPPRLPVLIRELVEIVRQDSDHRDQKLAELTKRLDAAEQPRVRAVLLVVLCEVTGAGYWRDKIASELVDRINAASQIVGSPLIDLGNSPLQQG